MVCDAIEECGGHLGIAEDGDPFCKAEIGCDDEGCLLVDTIGLPWNFNDDKKSKHRPAKEENRREVISPFAIAAIRLMMLTGCRAGEILKLRWSEVDFENGILSRWAEGRWQLPNLPQKASKSSKLTLGAWQLPKACHFATRVSRVLARGFSLISLTL